MENLLMTFREKINSAKVDFVRYLYHDIDWSYRLLAVSGARGVGKTTLLIQQIKKNFDINSNEVLYASLDDMYFSSHSLVGLAGDFVKRGGKYLFLDEVHKYKTWSIEIKNIYDTYPELHVVLTASSILELYKGMGDLSRRLVENSMHGLSFREYLELEGGYKLPILKLEEILKNHIEIAMSLNKIIKPIVEFQKFIKFGYYPYYFENRDLYHQRLNGTVNAIMEVDLPYSQKFDFLQIHKLKKLLHVLAASVPYKPNIAELARNVEATRTTILQYLEFLDRAHLLKMLKTKNRGMSIMTKPEKVYLNNSNLMYALMPNYSNIGTIRETFFFNQVDVRHQLNYVPETDFLVDENYYFEIGGKNKGNDQIKGLPNSYVVSDNIEIGYYNHIPLWLFGFLY